MLYVLVKTCYIVSEDMLYVLVKTCYIVSEDMLYVLVKTFYMKLIMIFRKSKNME